ncbi:hypothetical protein BS78_K234300 [Paspalum vaginatum]|uniref:Uncharacterized protein n=1 Tax=Paspalum vaginatum TaxID=158149 RepID=A0A9W7XBN2_9POAL|nr:hypothetical protein BS78_K234300 [Paspalum vaginatum]
MQPDVRQEVAQNDLEAGPQPQEAVAVAMHKVRAQLRRRGGDLFTPQSVVIGPYHLHGDDSFELSEEQKDKAVRYLERFNANLEWVVDDELCPNVRECYTHLPEDAMGDAQFSRMILRDGCYVICLLVEIEQPEDDGTPNQHQVVDMNDNTSVRDVLYLLDNQIPLFALIRMLEECITPRKPAVEYIEEPIKNHLVTERYISKRREPVPPTSKYTPDLVHLVYSYFRWRPSARAAGAGNYGSPTGRWRRATDYSRYADLRFKCRVFKEPDDDAWTILDIRHDGGTLYIPFLQVSSSTYMLLRNLMALEEKLEERPVTAYCLFMSQVACTAEDVKLLQRAEIIQHFLGSDEEAANAFAELCDGVAMDIDNLKRNYLKPIWHKLEKRCSDQYHSCMGLFRERKKRLILSRRWNITSLKGNLHHGILCRRRCCFQLLKLGELLRWMSPRKLIIHVLDLWMRRWRLCVLTGVPMASVSDAPSHGPRAKGHQCHPSVQLHAVQEVWDLYQTAEEVLSSEATEDLIAVPTQLFLAVSVAEVTGKRSSRTLQL